MRPRFAELLATALALPGCNRDAGGKPEPAPVTAATSASAPVAAGGAPGTPRRPEIPHGALGAGLQVPTQACRALTVKGSASLGGKPLRGAAVLDGSAWVELADGAEISVKHASTAREVSLRGPGSVLACSAGEERFLMTGGRLSTTPTLGVRPGAEVLVGTPLGVVRYGDGRLTVTASADALEVDVTTGAAWLESPGAEAAPESVPAGKRAVRKGPPLDVKTLVAACEAAALAAESRARDVLAPSVTGSAPLGERAQAHVQARRGARSACATARARLGPPAGDPGEAALERRLSAADARWQGVPSRLLPRPAGSAPESTAGAETSAPGASGEIRKLREAGKVESR